MHQIHHADTVGAAAYLKPLDSPALVAQLTGHLEPGQNATGRGG